MIELLRHLCDLSGPSGCEEAVSDFIRAQAAPYADKIFSDNIGNLFVFKKGRHAPDTPVMLAAHMDEVGIIIKQITDEGMLKFGFVGGVDRRVTLGRRLLIGEKRIPGVIGIKAVHLTRPDDRKTTPKTDELYIDIGACSREEAESRVSLGDYGVFDSAFRLIGEDCIKARAIDDRFGCAVMLLLLREELCYDTWFVFTVQEEIGTRGAYTAAHRLRPGTALILETTTAADLPDVPEQRKVCHMGQGVVISFMDRGTIYDRPLHRALCRLADENHIPWQMKTLIAGGNDASAIQRSLDGVRCVNLSLPTRYLHSPSSLASLHDCEAMLRLTRLFLSQSGGI